MIQRLSVFFLLLISLVQPAFSQGEFIQRGNSGIGGGGGFSTNREMISTFLFAGYSFRGVLDLNFSYEKANAGEIQDGVLTPAITYYPVKQEDARSAPTFGISVGYSRYRWKSVSLVDVPLENMQHRTDTLVTDRMVDAIKLSALVCRRTGYLKKFFFQPFIGATASMPATGWEFVLRGGLAMGTRMKGGPLIIFTPSIERRSGVTTLVMSLGAVY